MHGSYWTKNIAVYLTNDNALDYIFKIPSQTWNVVLIRAER